MNYEAVKDEKEKEEGGKRGWVNMIDSSRGCRLKKKRRGKKNKGKGGEKRD